MYNFRNKFKRNFAKWCTFSEVYVNWHLAERTGITPTCSALAWHGIPNKPEDRTWKPYRVGDSIGLPVHSASSLRKEKLLFDQIDRLIVKQKLFLQPGFSREEAAALRKSHQSIFPLFSSSLRVSKTCSLKVHSRKYGGKCERKN